VPIFRFKFVILGLNRVAGVQSRDMAAVCVYHLDFSAMTGFLDAHAVSLFEHVLELFKRTAFVAVRAE
jgi:hypothetical protein